MNEVNETPFTDAGAHPADAVASPTAGVREYLHYDLAVDVAGLAQRAGLSRFQILRAFKRRYGMPPYAYQLRARIGMAQRALTAGQAPADVAAELGFVDQSHLCRHFKRLVGVTPADYARATAVRRSRRL
jgi:AraC-like DNA-binding protein